MNNLLCFSHLRWNFVYQRPQHLMSRFTKYYQVYFFEEPIFDAERKASLTLSNPSDNLWVLVPHLPHGIAPENVNKLLAKLLDSFLKTKNVAEFTFWYYTPMALEFSAQHRPGMTIYDCMDELSAFQFAPPQLKQLEKKLMAQADIVFTGGYSLYEVKKHQHRHIYPVPSSIDRSHFEKARSIKAEPADQCAIAGPKLGFYGVIDERFDRDLIAEMARQRPEWQLILIGPVVKIDPASLPQAPNIHYLGQKTYAELPAYLSGWNMALVPFLLNESTRFISPTKTPEYLAAGIPVISSAITDVVNPYGKLNLVLIGSTPQDFIRKIDKELKRRDKAARLAKADAFLASISWDKTFNDMYAKIERRYSEQSKISIAS